MRRSSTGWDRGCSKTKTRRRTIWTGFDSFPTSGWDRKRATRRLQNKTQVFPLPGSVFVHNRLTHSLEVSSLGKSLGDDVARILTDRHPHLRGTLFEEIGTIVQTAGLAHDMGNPPFGHSGEQAIQSFFTEGPGSDLKKKVSARFWEDITHFEGNANAFRLLTHQFQGRRFGGFVMTY